VAKGARLLARRIREVARENGIPVVQDPPLARALFKACKVGQDIPLTLYKTVAELLAFVYRRDEAAAGVR
jgi:flagellar biosynthesis protein FlhB